MMQRRLRRALLLAMLAVSMAVVCGVTPGDEASMLRASGEEEEEEAGDATGGAVVALATLTVLIGISVFFETMVEHVQEAADESNLPFVHTVFSELATLGFIGLLLFVVTKLDVLSRVSLAVLGEAEKLQETIEVLHMGLFFFILVFLVLCATLLRLGKHMQREWREFELGSMNVPCVVSEYALATEPPRSWRETLSPSRVAATHKAEREMVYVSLRRRFVDYRSNHPDPETAKLLGKDYQCNPSIDFPFHEYLSIISGEVMTRLIEIDLRTWLALEVFVVAIVAVCWQLGPSGEVWVMLTVGLSLVGLSEIVHRRIKCMRDLLTPTQLWAEAEKLRRDADWRDKHHLRRVDEPNEGTNILELAGQGEDRVASPPYSKLFESSDARDLTEEQLARRQRMLLAGFGTNGVRLAIFTTRLVFLLTAMHFATFLLRTVHHVHELHEQTSWLGVALLDVLFIMPSVLVTVMSLRIARDGIYAFSVEHLKVHRVATRVMRILKARQTLRTLRFIAEMKIYLRDSVQKQESTHHALNTVSESALDAKKKPLVPSRELSRAELNRYEMERRDINLIFSLFDVDGSGCVSRDEMARLLLAITHEMDSRQLSELMDDLVKHDCECQEISFNAFHDWCRAHMQNCSLLRENVVDEVFYLIDCDKSGFITVNEFIAIFKTLGQALDHDDIRELMHQMDRNGDGKIDLKEFRAMLHKHEV